MPRPRSRACLGHAQCGAPAPRRVLFALAPLVLAAVALPAHRATPVQAAGCPVISGFVYYDVNNNGIMDPGEPPIGGSPIQLRTSAGVVAGSTITAADGSYAFSSDTSPGIPTLTVAHAASFPAAVTDWTATRTVPAFDSSLGSLRTIELNTSGTITSAIKAESLDSDAAIITATVSGTLTLDAPGGRSLVSVPTVNAGSFDAAPFDGAADFRGASGHDFGAHTASDASAATINDPSVLAIYTGTGTLSFAAAATASSRTTGGGNALNQINTTAGAELSVVYRYTPTTCLRPATYTIVQTSQPAGYADGQETAGNSAPIPNTRGTDTISVTLDTTDRPNNNFGELKASLSGYVYVDDNNNGLRETGEAPIPGVTVTLGGAESRTATTNAEGYYAFLGLVGGTYTIVETQPAAYLDGKDTIGSQGGSAANDRFFDIALPAPVNGVDNNFGERYPPRPTVTPLPSGTPGASATLGTPGVPGTPTRPATISGTPSGSSTPVNTVAGAKTPGAPSAGSGVFGTPASLNVVVVGLAVFALSGWLAFLGLGRRKRGER